MIDPQRIAIQVAMRGNQLPGEDQATYDAAYTDGLAALDGTEWPKSAIIDAVLMAEAEIADMIGKNTASPYRLDLYGRSSSLASGANIPSTDDEDTPFIGVFSQINDQTDNLPLTVQPIQVVRRWLRGNYKTEIYYYAEHGARCYHTRTKVYYEGCVWSRDDAYRRITAVGTHDLSPIPDGLEGGWIAIALTKLVVEGFFLTEAGYYGGLAAQVPAIIAGKAAPFVLDAMPTNEPVKG